MKSVVYLLLLLSSFQVLASTLDELAGVYTIKPKEQIAYLEDGMSIEYKVAISKDKDTFGHNIIGLNEYIRQNLPDGKSVTMAELKCTGVANMSTDQIVSVNVACDNDSSFEQKINLGKVNLKEDTFQAPMYSSLYAVELDMIFSKEIAKN